MFRSSTYCFWDNLFLPQDRRIGTFLKDRWPEMKVFRIICFFSLAIQMFGPFALALTVQCRALFAQKWELFKVTWPKMKIFCQICFFPVVIPKFCPFRSSSYSFRDKLFCAKNAESALFSRSHDQKWKHSVKYAFFPWWSQNFIHFALDLTWGHD